MNKDNKILLLALIIIISSLILTSVENITGMAVNRKISKVSISPFKTYPGETIYVTVIPGESGVNEEAIISDFEGVKLSSVDFCDDSYKCDKPSTFDFIIPKDWKEGVYQIKIYDYSIKNFIKGDFTIKGGLTNG